MSIGSIDNMPAVDYARYAAYERQYGPPSVDVMDRLFARLCWVVATSAGAKDLSEEDFRLFRPPPPPPPPPDVESFKRGFRKYFGAKPKGQRK